MARVWPVGKWFVTARRAVGFGECGAERPGLEWGGLPLNI